MLTGVFGAGTFGDVLTDKGGDRPRMSVEETNRSIYDLVHERDG